MGDDITIGVTEIVNNIEVTAQPNDQIVDISVTDNSDEVTLNITPTVVEVNINKGSSYAQWGNVYGTLSDQTDLQNALNAKANLVDGKVPASELPSYVDDIIEVANYAALPATGETGKIYVTLNNNKIYRWSGSVYIEIASNSAIWGAITGTLSSQTDLQNALNTKVDKVTGKGLSTEDYTTTEKTKLSGIAEGAEVNVNADWNATTGDAQILNKPTIPSITGLVPYTGATGNVDLGTHKLTASDLVVNHASGSGVAASITKGGSGEALTVTKSSGSGNAASILGGVTLLDELHLNTDLADAYIASAATWNAKQTALNGTGFVKASGTTISYDNSTYVPTSRTITINGVAWNLSTDISYTVGGIWGGITGTLSSQTDLQAALDLKANDNAVVKLTGNQDISGKKSFNLVQTGYNLSLITSDIYNDGTIESNNGMLRLVNNTTDDDLFRLESTGVLFAQGFKKEGGTSSQFLMADGSVSTGSGGTVTGTGTTNTIPKFTSSTAIGNSNITDNGTVVAISTDATINGVNIGRGGGAISTNTRVGASALNANTTGSTNTSIGMNSLLSNTTGSGNVAVGQASLNSNTTGNNNTFSGQSSGQNNLTANNNTGFGKSTLLANTNGSNNVALGLEAGRYAGSGTTAMTSVNNSIYLGYQTRGLNATGSTNEIVIGYNVVGLGSNTTVLGNSSTTTTAIYGSVGIGTTSPNLKLSVLGANGAPASSGTTQNGVLRLSGGTGIYNVLDFGINETNDYSWIQSTRANNLAVYDKLALQPLGGNVGIGTTSPNNLLTLNSSGAAGNSTSIGLFNTFNEATNRNWSIGLNLHAYGDFAIRTSSTQNGNPDTTRFLINSNGNVGINTTTDAGYKLDVNGTGRFSGRLNVAGGNGNGFIVEPNSGAVTLPNGLSLSTGYGVGYIKNTNSSGGLVDFYIESLSTTFSSTVTANGSGSFSWGFPSTAVAKIGTQGTGGSLLVSTPSLNSSYESGFAVDGTYSGGKSVINLTAFGVLSGGPYSSDIAFRTTSQTTMSEKMRITSGGNVGIGTESPLAKLEVTSGSSASAEVQRWSYNAGNANYSLRLKQDVSDGLVKHIFDVVNNGTTYSNNLVLTNGLVGIGTTSPNRALVIVGGNQEQLVLSSTTTRCGIALNPSNTSFSPYIGSTANDIVLDTQGSERMRITSGGNVGIGISPSTKLHLYLADGVNDNTLRIQQGTNAYASGINLVANNDGGAGYNFITSSTNGGTEHWRIGSGAAASTMTISTGGTERMRIASNGNVLIGTTTDSGAKLKVGSGSGPVATPTYLQMDSTYANAATPTNQQLKIYLDKVSSTESYGFATSNDAGLFYHSGGVGYGYHAFCTSGTERMRIANNGAITATSTITASGGFFNSDIRLKDLTDYDYNVSDIKPITYLWKDGRDNKKHVGYSAQEVQKVMPDAVNEDEKGFLSVNYVEVLVAKIEAMEKEIAYLKSKI